MINLRAQIHMRISNGLLIIAIKQKDKDNICIDAM
jgi:hypothetical protein